MALTGLMAIAGAGLLGGSGLQINAGLMAAVQTFNTENISGSIQAVLTSTPESDRPALQQALSTAPDFMTGFFPDGVAVGNGTTTNVPQTVMDQASTVFPNVATFVSVYNAALGYAAEVFEFKATVAQAQNTAIEDLGFQYKNYSDVASGGVSSQFDVNMLPKLAAELPNLGTLFGTSNLSQIGSAANLAQSLIDQGFGATGGLESALAGMDLSSPDPAEIEKIRAIFKSIRGADLLDIISVTEFKPAIANEILTLDDALDARRVFSSDALAAIGDNRTFEELGRRLGNIGGNFKDAAALGTFYSSITFKSFESLNSMTNMLSAEMADSLTSQVGSGTGLFGNPKITDIIGSVSGIGYIDDIVNINQTQARLLAIDPDIAAFKNYLDTEPTITVEQITELISKFESKPGLQRTFQEADERLINCASRIVLEKQNIALAKIVLNPDGPMIQPADNAGLLSFASQLHSASIDTMGLGTAEFLEALVANDTYGQAIQASLTEGKNLSVLASAGIDPGTKMDPMDYARSLSN